MKTCCQVHSIVFTRLVAGFLSIFVASAVAERAQDLPKPTDYVNDFAHVLSPNAVTRLDRICAQLDHSKANTQVAILTVHSLDGDDAADWANKVEDHWRIGKKGSDRGMLVLLAVDDHKWRIDVGYGLEGILPDAELGDIGRLMVPYLRTNDYDDAVLTAVGKIAQIIAFDSKITITDTQAAPPVVNGPRRPDAPVWIMLLPLFFLLIFFGIFFLMLLGALGVIKIGTGGHSSGSDDSDSGNRGGGGSSDSSSGGSSDSGSGGGGSPSGGGEFGGGGAGGSW